MKAEDLGYRKNGTHSAIMTPLENAFLSALWPDHQGRENILSAEDLAVEFAGNWGEAVGTQEELEEWKRAVRHLQNHFLREHSKVPILSAAGNGGGYWIAENEEEAERFYASFRKRGMTGLVKAAAGKESAVVELMAQISFSFDDLRDKSGYPAPPPIKAKRPDGGVPLQMVSRFLDKMLADPQKYSADLRKISEKFGGILFSRVQARVLREKVDELNQLVGGLEL